MLFLIPIISRRSIWQTLEAKVTPLLAAVLSYADTNNNLDILLKFDPVAGDDSGWIVKLWMDLFREPRVTQINYRLVTITYIEGMILGWG